MTVKTILFETIAAADEIYKTLRAMIDVTIDCNAITYNRLDEETVRWLVEDYYCDVGVRKRIYPYSINIVDKSEGITTYKYEDLEIQQKYLPPADWEFVTKDNKGEIVDKTWWGYEDGEMNIGIYIENFL